MPRAVPATSALARPPHFSLLEAWSGGGRVYPNLIGVRRLLRIVPLTISQHDRSGPFA